jgi:hypothetical protein
MPPTQLLFKRFGLLRAEQKVGALGQQVNATLLLVLARKAERTQRVAESSGARDTDPIGGPPKLWAIRQLIPTP